ncbi:MAG TPA: heme-binding domain-containing protein [Anaerolineae bacterium]|nr:heme-binding domain-containing protein [Anaerolineae bacterium]
MLRKAIVALTALVLGGFLLIQLVPYGRNHTNPPVIQEPPWDSPQTQELFTRACADCHSNTTVWPWYSNVAPLSWLVYNDTMEGRQKFNVSEWNRPQEGDEAAEQVSEGEMPPAIYLPTHPAARLTAAEKEQLIRGLQATFGGQVGRSRGENDDD